VYQSPDARQKRILIFVQTRDSADILHKHLNQKYPNFRPKRVVGKGGWQGMDWDSPGGQQEALDDFNSGRSNLLVATSVLEEGLDIESCEMVIIFSQSLNLIRYIYTKKCYSAK
jgi:ERCC4-related helicase